jgi:hypothetical protein
METILEWFVIGSELSKSGLREVTVILQVTFKPVHDRRLG